MNEPSYGEGVDEQLDLVEFDDSRRSLWNAICATLDVILDKPESREARKHSMRIADGYAWRVPVVEPRETENWSIIWYPDGEEVVILYVGPWPPIS